MPEPTLTPRIKLFIGAAHVGSALPEDIGLCAPVQRWFDPAVGVQLPAEQPACDALLAQWASTLRQAGRLKTWRNELLGVYALPKSQATLHELPTSLAQLERGAARVLGILTHAVHLLGFAQADTKQVLEQAHHAKRLWMQQRSEHKTSDPGLWDTLSGGLLAAQDGLISGVLRETHEEAGLLPSDLQDLTPCGMVMQQRLVPDGHIVEAVWCYTAHLKNDARPHNLDGEAQGFACVTLTQLQRMVQDKQVTQEAILALRLAGVL